MFVTRLVRRPALLLVVLAAAGVSACGAQQVGGADSADSAGASPSATTSSSTATGPSCEQVWQDGARLERTYRGCVDDGAFVPSDVLRCSSGQRLVRYADRWYGVLGGTVHEASTPLDRDRDYVADARSCRG